MEALPRILLAAAVALSVYFLVEGVTSLLRSDLEASESQPGRGRPTSDAPPAKQHARDSRAEPARDALEASETLPSPPEQALAPPPRPEPPPPPAPPTQATDESQPAGPCEADLRVAGAAYVTPSAGTPLVLFSGPDVGKGLRGIGGHVAGKTIVAIYPTAVVLRGPTGRECWVKMSSAHAREVAGQERRASVRAAKKRHREEQREKAKARRKKRIADRKKR